MKITYIYDLCCTGGLEHAVRNRMEYLKKMGIESNIIFFSPGEEASVFRGYEYRVVQNDCKLKNIISESDVLDILSRSEYIFRKLQKFNRPLIHECHSTTDCGYLSKINKFNIKAVLFPSKTHMLLNRNLVPGGIPSFTVYNFPGRAFREENNAADLSQKKTILWVGRFDKNKNWRFLLKIAERIESQYKIKAVINPKLSPEYCDFMDCIKSEGLTDRFKVVDNCTIDEMPKHYKCASSSGCYLSTSPWESFGMTVVEALFSGCPSVLTNISPFREIAGDGALYYPLDDADKCLYLIREVCSNKTLRNNLKAAAEERLNIFNPDTICREFIEIINKTCLIK